MKPVWLPVKRIHMIACEPVGVLSEPFFIELHDDLPTDGTDLF